jgi:hypothetical protein
MTKKKQPVTFIARRRNLRLVEVSAYTKPDARGQQESFPGISHQFVDGRLDVDDEDTLEWFRSHPLHGNSTEGFIELAPAVPAPDDELTEIGAAAEELDADRVQAVLDAEKDGHKRDIVIATATVTIKSIKAARKALAVKQTTEDDADAREDVLKRAAAVDKVQDAADPNANSRVADKPRTQDEPGIPNPKTKEIEETLLAEKDSPMADAKFVESTGKKVGQRG